MDCLNKNTFCMACCNNFIGAGHQDKRMACTTSCNELVAKAGAATELKLSAQTNNALTDNEFKFGDVDEEANKADAELKKEPSMFDKMVDGAKNLIDNLPKLPITPIKSDVKPVVTPVVTPVTPVVKPVVTPVTPVTPAKSWF